ncbi:DUF2306 domain-containing protein [Actinoplanes sp. NEAU-A12]|uniref:DUF2306 domain-containing protein n=1 Tax=Actinoplanes sandaracinus TaxID=3045177 RepID=A0ABT6WSC4_9ACTN|nr:DUF2306 domain-containing protein [Actinoplanes sandaracinus]MDI6102637.1 DUF2306 domain-containing protein [Actinoplanes sandaracinus]
MLHASGATIALVLGAYNLLRRTRGDRAHRWTGRVWVAAMYWTILSSFAIREIRPGRFSWIHGLSIVTFVTLSIALWAAMTHRIEVHRRFMTGSYLGLLGALAGAVAVPQRDIPQWFLHEPLGLATGAIISFGLAGAVIRAARPRAGQAPAEAGTQA